MTVKITETGNCKVAVVHSEETIIRDGQTTLDFIANLGYEHDCHCFVLNKAAVAEELFKLSSGVAGEVVQKLVNYGFRMAIIGDYSAYTSKPLHDFIYESNRGAYAYFVADEAEALAKLGSVE